MRVVTHEMMDVSLRGLQGMKWVDANYDGKIANFDLVRGRATNDAVSDVRRAG